MNNSKGDKLITTNQDTTGIDDFDFENTTEDLDLTEGMDLELAVNPAEAAVIDAELTKETSMAMVEAVTTALLAEMTAEDLDEAPKAKKTKAPKAKKTKAPKVKVIKAPKVKVIKAKCSKESLSVMTAGMAALAAAYPKATEVSRKEIMEVGHGLVLKDVYREMLHPSFKGASRGMYTIAVIVASLEKQTALLS